jgi:hypothetical protein
MTEAADQARAAKAHFLRARISISDPALMEMVAGFAVLANALEALAVQLADMKQSTPATASSSTHKKWAGLRSGSR